MPRRVDNVPSASRNRAARNRRMELCVRKHARRASGSTGARCSGLLEHEEKGGGGEKQTPPPWGRSGKLAAVLNDDVN
jgi:hypothetical protein